MIRASKPLDTDTGVEAAPITTDCDKLCRSLGDALTGVVFADDRQIATWHAEKVYTAGSEGATVEIRELHQHAHNER